MKWLKNIITQIKIKRQYPMYREEKYCGMKTKYIHPCDTRKHFYDELGCSRCSMYGKSNYVESKWLLH